jgi:alpha-amylase
MMKPICLYFQAHQPYRLRRFNYFDVGRERDYFDVAKDAMILARVSERCYRPVTALLGRLIQKHGERFAVSFSFSGTLLEQLRDHEADVLEGFRELAATDRVEVLSETYFHSLAWLASRNEFVAQVAAHRELARKLFGSAPKVFRNTELIYSDELARFVEELGYDAILADGVAPLLRGRTSDAVYRPEGTRSIRLLLRNYRLSDDIAFRFGDRRWKDWPLTAEKYVDWLESTSAHADLINLFLDLETFGEHHLAESGIFPFFEEVVDAAIARGGRFVTPTEAAAEIPARDALCCPRTISWADEERDLSAWQGNELQRDALRALFALERAARATRSADLLRDWRKLTTSDHFYYMCTKHFADGDVHRYFNPYESPYEAYIATMHVLSDLERRLERSRPKIAAARAAAIPRV